MTFTSPLPSVRIPASPLTPYTLGRAGRRAGKTAFIDGATGRTMTYGECEEAVRRQAGGWLESGLAKGEAVAVMAPICPEYAVIFHAVALAGGVLTTVNPTYTAGEVHHQLVDSGATRLVTIPMFLETAAAAIADSAVKEVYVIGEAEGYASIASLDSAPLAERVPVDLDDVVVVPYSSGTTGLAKGVMLTHRNLVSNIEQALGTLTMQEDDAFMAVMPFFHIYGMQVLMNTGLRAGATIVTMARFDLEQFLALHA
jgi:acyl-CoA synthetase (AMP-forming)/AMP-acid ligase II